MSESQTNQSETLSDSCRTFRRAQGAKAILTGAKIIIGDCLAVLPTLPAASVQCCVTSPPYWGLRDYGTATWEGGEAGCDHKRFNRYPTGLVGTDDAQQNSKFFKNDCPKCGARRIDSQLGLEPTPEEFVSRMVAVFRDVWRVLKDDGTLWVNMGDSYASNPASGGTQSALMTGGEHKQTPCNGYQRPPGLKPKDLCGIPWRLAFALQADGWYLRSDIIWAKPNPMPESVTDRPTKSHEYIFLLSKAERYFYDADAIREPHARLWDSSNGGNLSPNGEHKANGSYRERGGTYPEPNENGRNKRSVWTVATQPYAEAHFATFPEDLIKPCIMAGSRFGDTVLDPFLGSGTTAAVALELGRSAIGIELNPAYAELARARSNVTPGFL
jgi:DNA modification methylase